jgi:predicted O-methyltransferase YrrM
VSKLRTTFTPLDVDRTHEWNEIQQRVAILDIGDRSGAVNKGDRRAIYELARQLGAKTILEVGTHVGGSTVMLALALEKNGGGKLTSVDIQDVNAPGTAWQKLGLKYNPRESVKAVGCPEVTFHAMPSLEFLRTATETYDLIFLDGGHEAATVYQELPAALKLLNPNGVILLHDFFPNAQPLWDDGVVVHGPWHAVDRHRSEGALFKVQPLGDLRWPTKQGSNRTSLAVAAR